jgi:hypothetical protein
MPGRVRHRVAGGVCECSFCFLSLRGYPQVAFDGSARIGQGPALR